MSGTDADLPENPGASDGRLGRVYGLLCLVLAVAFLGGLIHLMAAGTGQGLTYFLVPVTGLALLAVLLVRRFKFHHWIWVAGSWMVIALLLAFLATDEPAIQRPVSLEKISPSFPGAAISSEVLLRFAGMDGQTLGINNRRMLQGYGLNMSISPDEPVKFRNFLLAQGPEIEADWDDMVMIRAWWTELAAFDRLGDTSPGKPDDPNLPFQPMRAYWQTAVAIAGLQTLAGDGDGAFATLQPAMEVARKLEPSSRSLVRSMISRVGLRQTIDAANFVLDNTPVSPEVRARFATALANGSGGAEGARHVIAAETARTAYLLEDPITHAPGFFFEPGSWQSSVANVAGPVLYNPRRTVNAFLEWSTRMQDLAARRDFAQMDVITKAQLEDSASLGVRNPVGSYLLQQATPAAYGKIIESYWRTEDAREALIKRLKSPGPASPPSTPAPPPP